ncbi:MAG TPA: fasciclin domain-containing protein, partial [Prolixibacteraceae bacterium]|nr:fasciclin domain-containing protein [Prolixibacteraceae bacterium]
MKYNAFLRGSKGTRALVLLLLLFIFLITGCNPDPQIWNKKSNEMVAGDYILANKDQFSEFGKLVEMTHLDALLNIRGPFTILLPNDEAMNAYYVEKGVGSLNDFTDEQRMDLVKNHIV